MSIYICVERRKLIVFVILLFGFKLMFAQADYERQLLSDSRSSNSEEESKAAYGSFITASSNLQQPERSGTFQAGDAVRINIWREPELSGDYSISSTGSVQFPLIGKVQVKGLTTMSLTSFLKAEYGAFLREPDIQVVPLIRVSVLGGVGKPGLYRVEPESSLWDLLADAGGPVKGRIEEMRVVRGGQVVIKNILIPYEHGDSLLDIGIRSGDAILIPTKPKIGVLDVLRVTSSLAGFAALIVTIVDRTR